MPPGTSQHQIPRKIWLCVILGEKIDTKDENPEHHERDRSNNQNKYIVYKI
jgi:hypothetical protein